MFTSFSLESLVLSCVFCRTGRGSLWPSHDVMLSAFSRTALAVEQGFITSTLRSSPPRVYTATLGQDTLVYWTDLSISSTPTHKRFKLVSNRRNHERECLHTQKRPLSTCCSTLAPPLQLIRPRHSATADSRCSNGSSATRRLWEIIRIICGQRGRPGFMWCTPR